MSLCHIFLCVCAAGFDPQPRAKGWTAVWDQSSQALIPDGFGVGDK